MASNEMDWQVGLKTIGSRAGRILNSGQWSDCSFTVGNEAKLQIIPAHRLILAMASPVFEAMFYGRMAEKDGKPIEILDVQPQAFNALLKYIYTDEINLTSFDQVCEICYAAKKYMITPLVEQCTNFIWKDLHPGNVCRAYEFAKLFEEPQLIEKCLSMIKTKAEDVIRDPSFEEIDVSTLKTILLQDTLDIGELGLWEGSLQWAKQECLRQGIEATPNNQRLVLQEVLPLFRFLTLSSSAFANGPALSNILTKDESFGLLMNISSPGVAIMPQNFSSSTSNRQPQKQPPPPPSQPESEDNFEVVQSIHCHCSGPLYNTFINDQLADCTLNFSVDGNVFVTGIILPTQLRPHGCIQDVIRLQQHFQSPFRHPHHQLTTRPLHMNKYQELIYAFIQDSQGYRMTYTHFSASVSLENTMEVLFNTPIRTSPNVTYKIVVVLNKMGRYPLYVITPRVSVGGLEFTFDQFLARDTIIKTLIFRQ